MKLKLYNVEITYNGNVLAISQEEAEKLADDIVNDCDFDREIYVSDSHENNDDEYVFYGKTVRSTRLDLTPKIAQEIVNLNINPNQFLSFSSKKELLEWIEKEKVQNELRKEIKEKQINLFE